MSAIVQTLLFNIFGDFYSSFIMAESKVKTLSWLRSTAGLPSPSCDVTVQSECLDRDNRTQIDTFDPSHFLHLNIPDIRSLWPAYIWLRWRRKCLACHHALRITVFIFWKAMNVLISRVFWKNILMVHLKILKSWGQRFFLFKENYIICLKHFENSFLLLNGNLTIFRALYI